MYHSIVRRRVRALFDAVNAGDAAPVLATFAPRFEHFFLGDHALGGSRKTLAAVQEWYALYRLLPDIRFDLRAIAVSGPPWNTLAVVEWNETNSGTDGVRTHNRGVHVVKLVWGRATFLGIYPDTAGLLATLDRLAEAGTGEAHAEAIEDWDDGRVEA